MKRKPVFQYDLLFFRDDGDSLYLNNSLAVKLPLIRFSDQFFLIMPLSLQWLNLFESDTGSLRENTVVLSGGLNLAGITPAGNLSLIGVSLDTDQKYQGSFIYSIRQWDRFSLNFGIAYRPETSELPIPLLGFRWFSLDEWEINLLLPALLSVNYRISPQFQLTSALRFRELYSERYLMLQGGIDLMLTGTLQLSALAGLPLNSSLRSFTVNISFRLYYPERE